MKHAMAKLKDQNVVHVAPWHHVPNFKNLQDFTLANSEANAGAKGLDVGSTWINKVAKR